MEPLSTQQCKETVRDLLAFVKSIAPQLSEIAGKREFEIVITNDKDGIGMSCSMGWDPLKDDEPVVEELPEGVDVAATFCDTIIKAMAKFGCERKKVAEALGISTRTLSRKLKEYRITLEDIDNEVERQRIQAALDECGGNSKRAAEKLGMSRKALGRKMLILGL